MRQKLGALIGTLIFFPLLFSFFIHSVNGHAEQPTADSARPEYHRIVSLSPAVTHTLYVLGLQDQLVGVTKYCRYPSEALSKPRVGGLVDTNFEVVYSLEPDLVILEEGESEQKAALEKMGLKTFVVKAKSISEILDSLREMGKVLDREDKTNEFIRDIKDKIDRIQARTEGLSKPRVIVTFGRPLGEGGIREVYIAGRKSYFQELIEIAGGTNAYNGPEFLTSPVVSAEGILHMNPDVILELVVDLDETGLTQEEILNDWAVLDELKAYKNKRIILLTEPYSGLPGPLLNLVLKRFAQEIHPEIDWNSDDNKSH